MEVMGGTVLVVDDDPDIREVLKDRLEYLGYPVRVAADGKACLQYLEKSLPEMIFLDIEMPGLKGLDVLKKIRRQGKNIPVVMITAYGSIDRAVQAMKDGAYDFITKPFNPDHVAVVARKALEREQLARGIQILSQDLAERHQLVVGQSSLMNQAVEVARKVASSKATVLLLGESGTGKELFARAIHNWSERRDKPFVAINCVGLSRELLESELFGHERGAFTGAHQLKRGKMELAHAGTAFLDEIGDVSPEIQTKLLRFLQEREFERVGGTETLSVDVRIIAATNQELEQKIKDGHFRSDLYYRLNVVPLYLPPLRERKDDIPILANSFLLRFAKESKKQFAEFAPDAMEKLRAYDWPGNVRELANVIESAVVLGQGPKLTTADLPSKISARTTATSEEVVSYHEAVDAYRRELIRRTLARTQGSRVAAAKILGLQRTYLSRLIKSLRLG